MDPRVLEFWQWISNSFWMGFILGLFTAFIISVFAILTTFSYPKAK